MNATQFKGILAEVIDENPLAIRAVLKILRVEFTERVPTLAVTNEDRPRLLVNLRFLAEHCHRETHVKAVICHEFLHVLLRHTEQRTPVTPADHLATDAVINAIIHRSLGLEYSGMMSLYYRTAAFPYMLLRPADYHQLGRYHGKDARHRDFAAIWKGLYDGKLCVDDIRDIAKDLANGRKLAGPGGGYLGNHNGPASVGRGKGEEPVPISPALAEALDRSLRSMNGDGIWRQQPPGVGASAYQHRVPAADAGVERWKRQAFAVLRRHLLPDPLSPREPVGEATGRLPVLNAGDRRGFARALWSPLLPDIAWHTPKRAPAGRAQVYLDVSGSMNAEMPLIVALLARLAPHIKRPFWAFSNAVAPAVIRGGQLVAPTTGGTSMSCVLQHLVRTRPRAAVVVTDGYIEQVPPQLLAECRGTRLHAIVTRDGSPAALCRAGIPYTQLGRLPQ